MSNNYFKKGFTLIELLTVVIIIAVLAVIATPQYFSNIETTKAREAINFIHQWQAARVIYTAEQGQRPTANINVTRLGLDDIRHQTGPHEFVSNFQNFTVELIEYNNPTLSTAVLTRRNDLYAIAGTDTDIYCCWLNAGSNSARAKKVCNNLASTDILANDQAVSAFNSGYEGNPFPLQGEKSCYRLNIND